jgi:hypothetical protein
LASLAAWLPSIGHRDSYDIFISYRQAADRVFVKELYHCLVNMESASLHTKTVTSSPQQRRRLEVFWDEVRLEKGCQWNVDFLKALLNSKVAIPIVSTGALKNMLSLATPGYAYANACDNVLLEWWACLIFKRSTSDKLEHIFPIIRTPNRRGAAAAAGHATVQDVFALKGGLPNTVHQPTLAKMLELFGQIGFQVPDARLLELSVAGIVDRILENQAEKTNQADALNVDTWSKLPWTSVPAQLVESEVVKGENIILLFYSLSVLPHSICLYFMSPACHASFIIPSRR